MQYAVQWVDGCRRCDSSKKHSMALFGYKYGVVRQGRGLVCSWWRCGMRVDRWWDCRKRRGEVISQVESLSSWYLQCWGEWNAGCTVRQASNLKLPYFATLYLREQAARAIGDLENKGKKRGSFLSHAFRCFSLQVHWYWFLRLIGSSKANQDNPNLALMHECRGCR